MCATVTAVSQPCLGKLLSEQIAMLEFMVEDFGYMFGAVPEAFMANLDELQLCVMP